MVFVCSFSTSYMTPPRFSKAIQEDSETVPKAQDILIIDFWNCMYKVIIVVSKRKRITSYASFIFVRVFRLL